MGDAASIGALSTDGRRPYDSPVRRERAAATRDGIVAAGALLFHDLPLWNWQALTVRAVAERAGVSERTVYRYFPTERELRDAVMTRLTEEAEVNLDGLRIEGLQDLTARIFHYVAKFPMQRREPQDETAAATGSRNRDALLDAIKPVTGGWSATSRATAAGMLDVLWSMVSYERLVMDWGLDTEDAIAGITWVMGLIEDAIKRGQRPG